jgi:hypothetical protein
LLNLKDEIGSPALPTLAANIASTDTSFSVAAGTGTLLPTDNFLITIDAEIMFVGSRSTDTLSSITRGAQGTTATSHTSGTTVNQFYNAIHHNQLAAEVNAIETQLGVNFTGGGLPWSALAPATVVTPTLTNYTWLNQNSATASQDARGAIYLTCPGRSGHNWNGLYRAAPATPYTITIGFVMTSPGGNYGGFGMFFYESGTSKLTVFVFRNVSGIWQLESDHWTNTTTVAGAGVVANYAPAIYAPIVWLQIGNDGTNLTYALSVEGANFLQVGTETKTAFFTTGPNNVGFGFDNYSGVKMLAYVVHFTG